MKFTMNYRLSNSTKSQTRIAWVTVPCQVFYAQPSLLWKNFKPQKMRRWTHHKYYPLIRAPIHIPFSSSNHLPISPTRNRKVPWPRSIRRTACPSHTDNHHPNAAYAHFMDRLIIITHPQYIKPVNPGKVKTNIFAIALSTQPEKGRKHSARCAGRPFRTSNA